MAQFPRFASLIAAASLAALSGCSTPDLFHAPEPEAESIYGAYLAARYAGGRQAAQAAAELYADALSFDPDSAYISERAFYASLIAGDFERARSTARTLVREGADVRLASIYLAADALAEGRDPQALEAGAGVGRFDVLAAQMLQDWIDVAGGREARAAENRLDVAAGVHSTTLLHRALILDAAGYRREAEGGYIAAARTFNLANFQGLMLGRYLEREGRGEDAAALYELRMEEAPDDAATAEALARVRDGGRRPKAFTPAQGAARALFPAAALFNQSAPADYTILYLRVIERLDPDFARNTLFLASVLEDAGYEEEALELYARLAGTSFADQGALRAVWLRFRQGEDAIALEAAREEVERTGGSNAILLLADLYRASGRCPEAIPLYRAGAERRLRERREPDWRLPFFEGVCLQIGGDWEAAEARYLDALEIAPDEPRVLNHVGYNWIVFGKRTGEAFEMISRAAELEPDNGAIVDSLGWALFKMGRYEEAAVQLERAVELRPYDPTLNWHLGDAYWRIGREREARFQWRRALDLDPEPREIRLINARIENGLDQAPPDLE